MPDPLLGFALQSFAPLVQPSAVSSACALLTFRDPSSQPENQHFVASAEAPRQSRRLPLWEGPQSRLAFKALLHTRVRHIDPTV